MQHITQVGINKNFYDTTDYLSVNYLTKYLADFDSTYFKKVELLVEHVDKDFDIFDIFRKAYAYRGGNFIQVASNHMLYIAKNLVVEYHKTLGRKYNTINIQVYSETKDAADTVVRDAGIFLANYTIDDGQNFLLHWYYYTSREDLSYVEIKELFSDELIDSAYPVLKDGVAKYVDDYLNAEDAVLVLVGPPGTGKSKLVRYILARMSQKYGYTATAMYTGDERALSTEQLFINFCSSDADAIIIEDIDYLLEPRSSGNKVMDSFLRAADGVVRAQQRKMIFTTNIASINDADNKIDEALLRPGRTYDVLHLDRLTLEQSTAFLHDLTGADDVSKYLPNKSLKNYSLAELYRAVSDAK